MAEPAQLFKSLVTKMVKNASTGAFWISTTDSSALQLQDWTNQNGELINVTKFAYSGQYAFQDEWYKFLKAQNQALVDGDDVRLIGNGTNLPNESHVYGYKPRYLVEFSTIEDLFKAAQQQCPELDLYSAYNVMTEAHIKELHALSEALTSDATKKQIASYSMLNIGIYNHSTNRTAIWHEDFNDGYWAITSFRVNYQEFSAQLQGYLGVEPIGLASGWQDPGQNMNDQWNISNDDLGIQSGILVD